MLIERRKEKKLSKKVPDKKNRKKSNFYFSIMLSYHFTTVPSVLVVALLMQKLRYREPYLFGLEAKRETGVTIMVIYQGLRGKL